MLFPKDEQDMRIFGGLQPRITNKTNTMYWSIRLEELILYINNKYISAILIKIKQ